MTLQKKMKKILVSLLCFITFSVMYPQSNNLGKIEGQIFDEITEDPIAFATITLISDEEKVTTGTVSNKRGKFSLKQIPFGIYRLEVQFMGYDLLSKNIKLSKDLSQLLFDQLFLKQSNTILEDVTVQNTKTYITQKADRKIIHVGKDITATGGNALQVLQNIPSVSVDLQSGNIRLRGNENVRILINGKPLNMNPSQLLRQTPSSLLKQIEIITSPSAKYNPEGMSGIINFILKKNSDTGINGTVFLGIEHSKSSRSTKSLDLNYNNGSMNFYGNYSNNFGKYKTLQQLERTDKFLTQNFDFLHDFNDHTFQLGSDFFMDKKNTLSLQTFQTTSDNSLKNKAGTQYDLYQLVTDNLSRYKMSERIYNLDYKHTLSTHGSLEVEVNYSIHKNPEESMNTFPEDTNNKLYDYTNTINDTRRSWLVNVDFEKMILDSIQFELGLEYRSQLMHNSIVTNQEIEVGIPPTLSQRGNTEFDYDRFIYSGYFNFQKKFKKISLQAGVRLEQYNLLSIFSNTEQIGTIPYSDKAFNIYPSTLVTYAISEKEDLQLTYNRRVERPSFIQVTPIQEWVSPLTTSQGNQRLHLQFTNSFELNYLKNFSKGTLNFGTFYRKLSNRIGRIIQKDKIDSDQQIISYGNYDFAENYGAEFSLGYTFVEWWTTFSSIETYIQQSEGIINDQMEAVSNTYSKIVLRNSFKISDFFNANLIVNHRGKRKNIQFEVKPYTTVDIAASISLLNDKATLTVRGSDIFDALDFRYTANNPFPQKGFYDLEYDQIYIGFSYAFGSSEVKKRSRRERNSHESSGSFF